MYASSDYRALGLSDMPDGTPGPSEFVGPAFVGPAFDGPDFVGPDFDGPAYDTQPAEVGGTQWTMAAACSHDEI